MTRINLLPWREAYRRRKNAEYYKILLLCMALAGALGFGGLQFAQAKVDFQEQRNALLEREIAELQAVLAEISELEQTKHNLLARMEIIQQLQGQRPQIVHTFHEIASRVPDGVYLTDMRQQGDRLMVLEGRAESNARVSALMRRIDRSDYFSQPRLEVIEADKEAGISTFKMSVRQESPNLDPEFDDGLR